ncbi:MAG: hypothetical protein JEZ07_10170 [Phycisphaerae bacterium]|nr:hypothetical protein [Phycisphaerae bacterium]
MKSLKLTIACLLLTIFCFGCGASKPLNARQKGQLIWQGRITDSQNLTYDIYLCPGYEPVLEYSRDNFIQAGKDFTLYTSKPRWAKMGSETKDCLEFSYEDCLRDFIVKDGKKVWDDNLTIANRQVNRKSFGWWLAYPWALTKSTVDNVFRVPIGLIGSAGGVVGSVIVPAWYGFEPTGRAVFNGGVEGCGVTALGLVWNTAATPLLSLTEFEPTPARADGIWVKLIEFENTPADIDNVARLGTILIEQTEQFDSKRQQAQQDKEDKLKELENQRQQTNVRYHERLAEINDAESDLVRQLIDQPTSDYEAIVKYLKTNRWSPERIDSISKQLKRKLPAAEYKKAIRLLKAAFEPVA